MTPESGTTTSFDRMITACELAARATQLVRQDDGTARSWTKHDKTPVTVADFASQAILLGELAHSFPNETVLAEEEIRALDSLELTERVRDIVEDVLGVSLSQGELRDRIGYRGGEESSVHWLVDPLDGTKGFIRGHSYAIALARLVNNQLDHTWMAVPGDETICPGVSGHLFCAARGQGAKAVRLVDGAMRDLAVRTDRERVDGRVTIAASYAKWTVDIPPELVGDRWHFDLLSLESQAKYAALATGAADLYPRKPGRSYGAFFCWDHASGALLLEETGGRVTDLAGEPLDWSQGGRLSRNRGLFATATPGLHESLLPAFRRRGLK